MKFKPIINPSPADLILKQILLLMKSDKLHPGERLPPEAVLQKAFNVTKQQLKDALKKLEIYGVVETKPQSGTFVANIYGKILEGLVSNIIDFDEKTDFAELFEARLILEVHAVQSAAKIMSAKDLNSLKLVHKDFVAEVEHGRRGDALDIYFHMEILRFSKNKTMVQMFSLITKKMVDFWLETRDLESYVSPERLKKTIIEHEQILEALEKRDAELSAKLMKDHLDKGMNALK